MAYLPSPPNSKRYFAIPKIVIGGQSYKGGEGATSGDLRPARRRKVEEGISSQPNCQSAIFGGERKRFDFFGEKRGLNAEAQIIRM